MANSRVFAAVEACEKKLIKRVD